MASSPSSRATKAPRSPESFESLRIRSNAAEILQSYEMLSWHSFHRRESLQQTRLHFQNITAGFKDADEAPFVEWKVDSSPRTPKPGDEPGVSRKGKERVIAGDVADPGIVGSGSSPRSRGTQRRTSGGGRSAGASGSGSGSAKKKRKSGAGPWS